MQIFKTPLTQVINNLIDNALKYVMPDVQPIVKICCTENDLEWIISIKDNGIGIDPKHHKKVFELFQRLHTRQEYSGTGIGLVIVKKTIESWGGKIWVESSPSQGSTFIFTILK